MRTTILLASAVLAACGGDGGGASDPPDGGPDAAIAVDAPPAADSLACLASGPPGSVTVDGPSLGTGLVATVIVHDATGAVLEQMPLASNATAAVTVPSCGMISVHQPVGDRPDDLITWTGVQPGDRLVHFSHQPPAPVERLLAVELAAAPAATSYRLQATCGRGSAFVFGAQPGVVTMSPNCAPDATTVSVLVLAIAPTGPSFALAAEVPLVLGGTTAITPPAYRASDRTLAATVRGVGAFAGGAVLVDALVAATPTRQLALGTKSASVTGVDQAVALPVLAEPGTLRVTVATDTPGAHITSIQRAFTPLPATLELELATDFLATPDGVVDTALERPTVTWTASGGVTADLAIATLELQGGEAGVTEWRLVMPAVPGAARFPALPAGFATTLLPPTLLFLDVMDRADVTSYDVARAQLFDLLAPGADSRFSRFVLEGN